MFGSFFEVVPIEKSQSEIIKMEVSPFLSPVHISDLVEISNKLDKLLADLQVIWEQYELCEK